MNRLLSSWHRLLNRVLGFWLVILIVVVALEVYVYGALFGAWQ